MEKRIAGTEGQIDINRQNNQFESKSLEEKLNLIYNQNNEIIQLKNEINSKLDLIWKGLQLEIISREQNETNKESKKLSN